AVCVVDCSCSRLLVYACFGRLSWISPLVALTSVFLFFFFSRAAPTEIYTFPYTTLFRSSMARSASSTWAAIPRSSVRRCASVTLDRKSTRLNSSHVKISYAVFCLKKKTEDHTSELQSREQLICLILLNITKI